MKTYDLLRQQGESINSIEETEFDLLLEVMGSKKKEEKVTPLEEFIKHI